MTAVAELRAKDIVVGSTKGGHPSTHHVWLITWRGAAGRVDGEGLRRPGNRVPE